MLRNLKRKGQTGIEYVALLIVLIAGLIGMQMYFKRAIQGRMRSSLESVGDQYDPMSTNSDIQQTISGYSTTTIVVQDVGGGKETIRRDNSIMSEKKTGSTQVYAN